MANSFDEVSDSSSDDEDTLFLIDTAFENSRSFAECWHRYNGVSDFLTRHDYIPVRATTVSQWVDQEELWHQSDVDGVTIEWDSLANGLKSDFSHFQLLPYEGRSLRRLYPIVKKHLNLSCFNANSFSVLKECAGTQIIYDGVWETWIGLIPSGTERAQYDYATQSSELCKFLSRVRIRFQDELKDMCRNGVALETLAKNNLEDAKRMFILPNHQFCILRAFETSLNDTELTELPYFRKILLTFRFGDKCRSPLILPLEDSRAIRNISIHIGHTISCAFADLFWSRQGLQEVAGCKCIFSTCNSFMECANVQSALDRSKPDVSANLRAVCRYPENIQFVQLYSDLPHRYPKTRVHPVSGSVLMMEGILNDSAQRNLYDDAKTYISEIGNNFFQYNHSSCRLEFVISLNEYTRTIDPSHFIQVDSLSELLDSHPMIVPFSRSFGTLQNIRKIGLHLTSVLDIAFRARRGTSDTRTVWEVYQAELAVEKLLWGHPLCRNSNLYSTNLGPGLQYPTRCLSDQRGFLCLENSGSCCVDETTLPPLNLYSKNLMIQRQITRVSGLYQNIGGSDMVLGCRVVDIFLRDCHANGNVFLAYEQFLLHMKAKHGNANKRIVGGICLTELVKTLCSVRKIKWSYVFGAVRKLLKNLNVNVEQVLQYGISSIGLGYFPAVRSYDGAHHEGLNWLYKYGFWVLTDVNDKASELERESAELHLQILTELERRKLCHTSNYRDIVFPWIKTTLMKTREKQLTQVGKIQMLCFVSCVAFLQLGKFVDYYALSRLVRDMPITQSTLKMAEVQCQFQLPGVNNMRIFRLHPSVQFHLERKLDYPASKEKHTESEPTPDTRHPSDHSYTEQIQEGTTEDCPPMEVAVTPVNHVPTNKCFRRWSPAELGLLAIVEDCSRLNNYEKFQAYQTKCRELEIPDRSWIAFKKRILRLRTSKQKEAKVKH